MTDYTPQQLEAIERRHGDLLLEASAGSGKTSVLVERFVRAVRIDGVGVGAILSITFTDKAAAEMRERIRRRLRELGDEDAARATEGAFISTIHGFCARLLRTHALAAGIDPAFKVLDEVESRRLAHAAFGEALEELARDDQGAIELIAGYGAPALRGAILSMYAELRSRGQLKPGLPPLGPAEELASAREGLLTAAQRVAAELQAIPAPGARVLQAIGRLERCEEAIADELWPGALDGIALPGGNGAALSTQACIEYGQALARLRRVCEHRRAEPVHALLDRLLRAYGARYWQHKREASGLDFEDLELLAWRLLRSDTELLERYRQRFDHVMVDELQDTNIVQLKLIELVSSQNLFTVGDALQSIYGFRHADVELFERRAERLAGHGARVTLDTNFRSRPEIIDVLNRAFSAELSRPLQAGREPAGDGPRVELLIVDRDADWSSEGLGAPWRRAEARVLAGRVGELIAAGAAPSEVVVLTRATTDLRAYERALEELGIPTYVIGGRGYWGHPQVLDLVCYLRALANPRDEEALYTVLASPLVGVSLDALVLLAAEARARECEAWDILRDPGGLADELDRGDRGALARFASWFADERRAATRVGIEALIDRVLERTGYDLAVLAMPGGVRRLANVRKLMRLGREYESAHGRDLRGFLELARGRAGGWIADPRESEAPVESEALDAVRLMTIHRAKGLEFEIVCVADLGRLPRRRPELMRVGRDGRFGLRLAEPGTGTADPALDYRALGDERAQAEAREERRLFYVAMTRAKERLILSGATKLERSSNGGGAQPPIAWIAPALRDDPGVICTVVDEEAEPVVRTPLAGAPAPARTPASVLTPPRALAAPPVSSLSYSSIEEYGRCGYRFYVERVLGIAPPEIAGGGAHGPGTGLSASERGVLVHALLEQLDFRRPVVPAVAKVLEVAERPPSRAEAEEIASLVGLFASGELCARLGRATQIRREQRFAFVLDELLITGVLDVIGHERGGGSLVVDYKSDRLLGADPGAAVRSHYATQRVVYALAALRSGAPRVTVAHCFLEVADEPVYATYESADSPALEHELRALTRGVLDRHFVVTDAPHRAVCHGCPAEGGLCSWPLEMTRREADDRLF